MTEPCASSTARETMFSEAMSSISSRWRPSSSSIARAISGSESARRAEKKEFDRWLAACDAPMGALASLSATQHAWRLQRPSLDVATALFRNAAGLYHASGRAATPLDPDGPDPVTQGSAVDLLLDGLDLRQRPTDILAGDPVLVRIGS